MHNRQEVFTHEQLKLREEFTTAYGIDPEEIIFFSDDPNPFFTYEATCVVLNTLRPDLKAINIQQVESGFVDSLTFRCELTFDDGRVRTAVGVVNVAEQVDGKAMGIQQLQQTASARAIRNALRTAGIDLVRSHRDQSGTSTRTAYAALLAQAHILGKESGLITDTGKELWHSFLLTRYGVFHSNELGAELLSDLVATLKVMKPHHRQAA